MTAWQDGAQVERVEAIPIALPLSRPMVFSGGEDAVATPVIVRVTLADGRVGYGEAQGTLGPNVVTAAIEALAPLIVGQPWPMIGALPDRVAYRWRFHPALRNNALAALEMALLDLQGQATELPVSELLGGRVRRQVDHFCWLHRTLQGGEAELADVLAQAEAGLADGFTCFSLRLGFHEPDEDIVRLVGELRALIGDEKGLRLDANQAWSYDDAVRILRLLHDQRIDFIEDPIDPRTPEELVRLRDATGIRICTDQMSFLPVEIRRFARAGAVQVVCTDPSRLGGLLGFTRMAAELADEGIELVRHCSAESGIYLAAALHAASAAPSLVGGNQHLTDLVTDDVVVSLPALEEGCMTVPDGPGLDIQVDAARLEAAAAVFASVDTQDFRRSRAVRGRDSDPRGAVTS